jgi:transposase-like protein
MAAIFFKCQHFQQDMLLQSVRWYLEYFLSCRDIEELMQERGFSVDYSTIIAGSFIIRHNWKPPFGF